MQNTIHDIFGNIINIKKTHLYPLIIITQPTDDLLVHVSNRVYRYNMENINKLIASNDFMSSGYVLNKPQQLLLIHKKLSIKPNNYLSLYMNKHNPIASIDKKYLVQMTTDTNEFNHTNTYNTGNILQGDPFAYTINRNMFKTNNSSYMFSLLSNIGNKYLYPDNQHSLSTEPTNFIYNVDGNIYHGDKYLTAKNNNVFFEKKNNSVCQMWYFFEDYIVSQCTGLYLVATNDNKIILSKNKQDAQWSKQEPNTNTNDVSYPMFRGKYVVLVKSDNPWYINKYKTTIQKYINTDMNEVKSIEYFDGDVNTNDTKVLMVVLLTLVLIIIIYMVLRFKIYNH